MIVKTAHLAALMLEELRREYSDSECHSLGYEDDDGASGLYQLEYQLRLKLAELVDAVKTYWPDERP